MPSYEFYIQSLTYNFNLRMEYQTLISDKSCNNGYSHIHSLMSEGNSGAAKQKEENIRIVKLEFKCKKNNYLNPWNKYPSYREPEK